MAQYLLAGALTILLASITERLEGAPQKLMLLLTAVPSSLVASFRFNIGPDWPLYRRIFDSICINGGFYEVKALEPGYILLNKLVIFLEGNYQVLLFVVAMIITCVFFAAFLRISDNFVLSVLLYFILGFYFDSLNGLRQYIAAAIVIYGTRYIQEGSMGHWVFTCLFAGLFHMSALPMVFLYPLTRNIELSTAKTLALICVFILLGNVLAQIITTLLALTRYSYYLYSAEFVVEPTLGTTIVSSVSILSALLLGVFKPRNNEYSIENIRHRLMTCMGLFALLSALMSFFIPLALRVQYYFMPFETIFIPYVLHRINNRNLRLLVGITLVCMFACMTVIGMIYYGWYGAYPYATV